MIKGRRRGRTPSTRVIESQKKSEKVTFQGRLSHTSPAGKITSYFDADNKLDVTPKVAPRNLSPVISVLQQNNNIIKKSPHRIEISDNTEVKKPKAPVPSRRKAPLNDAKSNKLTDYFPVRRSVRKTKKTVLEEKQKSIEEAVLSGREDGLECRTFVGKGRGIVSVKEFKRGDFVVEYAGELISLEEAKTREAMYAQDQNTGCYMYYFMYRNTQYCVDATAESKRLGRLVNHSRNGNLMTKTISVGGIPRLVLIAKEDINPGDELTYDYGDRSKESLRFHPWLAS